MNQNSCPGGALLPKLVTEKDTVEDNECHPLVLRSMVRTTGAECKASRSGIQSNTKRKRDTYSVVRFEDGLVVRSME